MKVYDILKSKGSHVHTVRQDLTVYDAVCQLVEHNIGALVVTDAQNRVVGIISERDILRTAHKNLEQLKQIPIRDVMTRDLIVGTPDDDIEYVEKVMTVNRIRHYPIFHDGQLAGIISIGDVVKHKLTDLTVENRHLRNYIVGKYPA